MTELKIFAAHWGIWFFVLAFYIFRLFMTGRDKAADSFSFYRAVFILSLATFAIHWGLFL